jgi:hypothetical protein
MMPPRQPLDEEVAGAGLLDALAISEAIDLSAPGSVR